MGQLTAVEKYKTPTFSSVTVLLTNISLALSLLHIGYFIGIFWAVDNIKFSICSKSSPQPNAGILLSRSYSFLGQSAILIYPHPFASC